ncbi:MAG: hypothetical protein H7841_18580, partial [Magnetospirillum sp. WYHS-4]
IPERIAYAREPRKLPVVLSADEVVRFLEAVPSLKNRTALLEEVDPEAFLADKAYCPTCQFR